MKTVVIDPGHGGYDPGAVNGTRYEKNDNLRLGLAVRDRLKNMGYNTIMTRDTDTYVSLYERAQIANRNNADIFVSLHRNSYPDPSAGGVENYTMINPSTTAVRYAQNVLDAVVNAGVQENRGLKTANFAVLRYTNMPAQLLEMGFITNTIDNYLFDARLNSYADAIAQGVDKSLGGSGVTQPPPSSGNATIKSIQQTLNNRYKTGLNADGIYGPLTKRALIKGLQTELNNTYGAGLTADGIFGPRTKAAVRNVKSGDRGNIVYLIQAMLNIKGYGITPDGIFGTNTLNAVKSFQKSNGLSSDGIVGKNTMEQLFSDQTSSDQT